MELEKHVDPSGRVPEDLFFFISKYFGEQTENFYNIEILPPNIIDFQIPLILDSIKCLMERN